MNNHPFEAEERNHYKQQMAVNIHSAINTLCEQMSAKEMVYNFSFFSYNYRTLSYTSVHYCTLSHTTVHYCTLSHTIVHQLTLSYTIVHYCTLSYTIVHYRTLQQYKKRHFREFSNTVLRVQMLSKVVIVSSKNPHQIGQEKSLLEPFQTRRKLPIFPSITCA